MAGLGGKALVKGISDFARRTAEEKRAKEAGRFDPKANLAKQEEAIKGQFASARRRVGGQQRETGRQIGQAADRLAARTGQTGGAVEKARMKATQATAQDFAGTEADLAAQEAAALSQAATASGAQQLQKEQLDFQRDSFAQQMAFQIDKFDEEKRINAYNQIISLEQSAIDNGMQLNNILQLLEQVQSGKARIPSVDRSAPIDVMTGRSNLREFG